MILDLLKMHDKACEETATNYSKSERVPIVHECTSTDDPNLARVKINVIMNRRPISWDLLNGKYDSLFVEINNRFKTIHKSDVDIAYTFLMKFKEVAEENLKKMDIYTGDDNIYITARNSAMDYRMAVSIFWTLKTRYVKGELYKKFTTAR